MSSRGRSFVLVAGAVVCAGMGLWQLFRLENRRAAIRPAVAALKLPVASLDDPVEAALAERAGLDFRRVSVTGRYDHAAEIVIRDQHSGTTAGVRIVTPLRLLRGDSAILVQRGFVPARDVRSVMLAKLEESGVRQVSGVALLQPDNAAGDPVEHDGVVTWREVDIPAIRARLPYPVLGFVVRQLPDPSLPELPRRESPPPLSDGPYLLYAILWFSLAVAALVSGVFRGLRPEAGTEPA
ncbi:MAG: SURF1 family protein [Gemmatimonadota bacterium]|nr:SURF1 family protein [Gemmatimonadota bacterium]